MEHFTVSSSEDMWDSTYLSNFKEFWYTVHAY